MIAGRFVKELSLIIFPSTIKDLGLWVPSVAEHKGTRKPWSSSVELSLLGNGHKRILTSLFCRCCRVDSMSISRFYNKIILIDENSYFTPYYPPHHLLLERRKVQQNHSQHWSWSQMPRWLTWITLPPPRNIEREILDIFCWRRTLQWPEPEWNLRRLH